MTEAVHLQNEAGDEHVVGIGDLRVMVVPDGDGWFAQGLEIDYAACGDSLEDVKTRFEKGLELTICKHLDEYGSITKLLVVAPNEMWADFFKAAGTSQLTYTHVSYHRVKSTPFDNIRYFQLAA